MIDKKHLENFLRVNGIEPTADNGKIKSLLLSARWNENDVDTAIAILREDPKTKIQNIESMNKLFRSEERLKPETLSSLLGVNIDILPEEIRIAKRSRSLFNLQILFTVLSFSVFVAALAVFCLMYFLEIGLFHPTVKLQ